MGAFQVHRWEDYTSDGTGTGVLRNYRGITNAAELARFEQSAAVFRIFQLLRDLVQGDFDFDHMKEVHRRIFQDVYPWAGHTRIGPVAPAKMTKSGPDVSGGPNVPRGPERVYFYYPSDYIELNIHPEFKEISRRNFLVDMNFEDFATELAESWAEINTGGSALLV